jgi:hypothetical protein
MKKFILIIAVLGTVQFANAQKVFALHAVKIEGNTDAFEKVETELMSKVSQDAVNKGDILYWGLFKVAKFNNGEVPGDYNYVWVQWANNIDDLLSSKAAWWNNVAKVLTPEEADQAKTLGATYKGVKDARNIFVVEDEAYDNNGKAEYFQFNFGRPANISGFIEENKTLWKPFFVKNMSAMNMKVWGVARRLTFPTMETSHNTVMSWDAFSTLNDLMKYRIGLKLPGVDELSKKSKMSTYMPDGFTYAPVFQVLKNTTAAKK